MTVVGTIELIAKIDTSQYKKGAQEVEKSNADMENSGNKSSSRLASGFSKVAKVGLAAVAAAAVAVGAAIVSNFGAAIKRVDTLNNATRTFQNMGFSASSVDKAMKALNKSINGLPTPLDAAVRGMQSLSATYGDVTAGQKIFTALNDAIIGFGGSAMEVENAVQQLSQLPMDGPLDAQTWNSLRNSGLTPVLVAMAKDMGISVNKMKEKFGEGELKVRDFTIALTRMDKEGGGGMKSLQKIAQDATSGIGTGWQNMNTAITRGIANIIEAIGSKNISNAISFFGSSIENGLTGIAPAIKDAIKNLTSIGKSIISFLSPSVKDLVNTISRDLLPAIGDLISSNFAQYVGRTLVFAIRAAIVVTTAIIKIVSSFVSQASQATGILVGLTAGFVAYQVVVTALTAKTIALTTAQTALNLAQKLNPMGLLIAAATGLVAAYIATMQTTNNAKNAEDAFTIARNRNALATQAAKNAEDALKDSRLAAQGASLAVEQAQNNLNNAISQYGPKSLQARQAAYDLKVAQSNLAKANSDVKNKTNDANKAQQALAKTKQGIVNALNQIQRASQGAAGGYNALANAISKAKQQDKKSGVYGIGPKEGKAVFSIPKMASGGIVTSSTIANIGEGREPEAVIPLSKLDKMIRGNTSQDGGGASVNISINLSGIMTRSKSDEIEIGKTLIRAVNKELRSKNLTPIGQGAI